MEEQGGVRVNCTKVLGKMLVSCIKIYPCVCISYFFFAFSFSFFVLQRLVCRQKGNQEKSVTWIDLFKTPRLRRNTLLMVATW